MLLKKLDLILYYGLIILAFTLPISIAATNIVWLFLFLIWLIKIILKKSEDFSSPVSLAILFFFVATVVFSAFGLDFKRSIKGINGEMLFFVFFLVFSNVKDFNHAKKIMYIFLISSALMGALGLFQYISGNNMLNDNNIFVVNNKIYNDWVEIPSKIKMSGLFNYRAHGTRSWAQTYAEGLLMALPPAIFLLLYSKKKYLYFIVLFIFLGIFFSYVRMVWISTIIILGIIIFMNARRLKNFIYVIAAVSLLVLISNRFIDARRNILERAADFSNPARIAMWKTSFEIFKDYPVFGVGYKNVKKVYPYYYQKMNFEKKLHKLSHLHSTFIHILVERGIIAFMIFLYLFGVYFYYGIKKAKSVNGDEKYFVVGCLFAIFGFLLSGLTEYAYGDSEVQMIMWFLMALTFYKSDAKESINI